MQANAAAITAIRERSGLSKSDLARAAGFNMTLLVRLESGERSTASPATLKAIAAALKVPILAIINGPAEVEQ